MVPEMISKQGRNGCPQILAKLLRGLTIRLAALTGKRDYLPVV